ncbi:MAG: hypothetical protein V3T02_09035 [Alphaproteobacteria bacterium]
MARIKILPQQRLLLELIIMSGDIGVPESDADTILWRTLRECVEAGWIRLKEISPGIHRASITNIGRMASSLSHWEPPEQRQT